MTAATTQLDFAADDGIVAGTPRRMLRLEGAAVAAGALIAYTTTNEAWWLIALTILLPDLSAIGFLAGSRVGTHLYNAAHTSSVPVIVVAIGLWQHTPLATALALVWLAHIGIDRALGYGLKYPDNPQHTHLSAPRPRPGTAGALRSEAA
jgi:Domain of unknown function (DUF4260)